MIVEGDCGWRCIVVVIVGGDSGWRCMVVVIVGGVIYQLS